MGVRERNKFSRIHQVLKCRIERPDSTMKAGCVKCKDDEKQSECQRVIVPNPDGGTTVHIFYGKKEPCNGAQQ